MAKFHDSPVPPTVAQQKLCEQLQQRLLPEDFSHAPDRTSLRQSQVGDFQVHTGTGATPLGLT